jgi:hypothetical protein
MKTFNRLNKQTQEYLQAPQAEKRGVLKKQYLSNRFRTTERERAVDHLNFLIEFTQRLNLVEGKSRGFNLPNPSVLRATDLFVVVEICAEVFREESLLKEDTEFWRCWTPFEKLIERVKSKEGTEHFFEAAYLLLYLAALIFKRHVMDGTVEKRPEILSNKDYLPVAARFTHPLFEPAVSAADQMKNLANNLQSLAHT